MTTVSAATTLPPVRAPKPPAEARRQGRTATRATPYRVNFGTGGVVRRAHPGHREPAGAILGAVTPWDVVRAHHFRCLIRPHPAS